MLQNFTYCTAMLVVATVFISHSIISRYAPSNLFPSSNSTPRVRVLSPYVGYSLRLHQLHILGRACFQEFFTAIFLVSIAPPMNPQPPSPT